MPPTSKPASTNYVDIQYVSLKEHFEAILRSMEKALDSRFEAQEKAIRVANEASDKRLDSMNEFRATLSDQNKTFATCTEINAFRDMMKLELEKRDADIESLKLTRAELAGKATQSQVSIAMILSTIGLLVGIVGIVLKLTGG